MKNPPSKKGNAAPRDPAPHLGRPPKPKPKTQILRPVQPPNTVWKSPHHRFDSAKRVYVPVSGHFAKKPSRLKSVLDQVVEQCTAPSDSLLRLPTAQIFDRAFADDLKDTNVSNP